MATIRLNGTELDALTGQRHIAIALYLVLRRRMNYTDGIVGIKVGVSWNWLAGQIRVEGHRGMPPEEFSQDQVRRAARQLEVRGLVTMRSGKADRRLIIQCAIADFDAAEGSPKAARPARQKGHQTSAQGEDAEGRQIGRHTNIAVGRQRTTPVSGNKHHHHHHAPEQHRGGGGELHFPENLTPQEQQGITNLITQRRLNGNAQLLLDELTGAMFTKAISNPIGYARRIATAMEAGTFVAEKGHLAVTVRERRVAELAREREGRETKERATRERQHRGEGSGYKNFKVFAKKLKSGPAPFEKPAKGNGAADPKPIPRPAGAALRA